MQIFFSVAARKKQRGCLKNDILLGNTLVEVCGVCNLNAIHRTLCSIQWDEVHSSIEIFKDAMLTFQIKAMKN